MSTTCGCEPKTVKLADDEIRTLDGYARRLLAAQERISLLIELNEDFVTQLRAKYGLDQTWICNDVLRGFERVEAYSHD